MAAWDNHRAGPPGGPGNRGVGGAGYRKVFVSAGTKILNCSLYEITICPIHISTAFDKIEQKLAVHNFWICNRFYQITTKSTHFVFFVRVK